MNARISLALLVLAAAMFAGGFYTGRRSPGANRAPAAAENGAPIPPPRRGPGPASVAQAQPRLTLAEVQAALAALPGTSSAKFWEQTRDFAAGVDPADIPAVLAMLDKLPRRDNRRSLRDLLLTRWGKADPAAALAYADKLKGFDDRNNAIRSVFYGWAEADLPAAQAWAAKLPVGELRRAAFTTVIHKLAETDPAGALACLSEISGPGPFGSYFPTVNLFEQWAGKDPQAAAVKAAEILTGQARKEAFSAIARRWADTDPQAALAWAGSLTDNGIKRSVLLAVTRQWADSDPQAAASYALALPDGLARNSSISVVAVVGPSATSLPPWSGCRGCPTARRRVSPSSSSAGSGRNRICPAPWLMRRPFPLAPPRPLSCRPYPHNSSARIRRKRCAGCKARPPVARATARSSS